MTNANTQLRQLPTELREKLQAGEPVSLFTHQEHDDMDVWDDTCTYHMIAFAKPAIESKDGEILIRDEWGYRGQAGPYPVPLRVVTEVRFRDDRDHKIWLREPIANANFRCYKRRRRGSRP